MDYFWLILGLITLVVGGEFLVKGAVSIALKFNISTLVVGMTIVSFGTSAPELIVSLKAALKGHPDLAIGNIMGSNIANISLVLGITALIFPIAVNRNSLRIDWPMMMIASTLFTVFIWDLKIKMWEGAILFSILIGFGFWLIQKSRKEGMKTAAESDEFLEEKSESNILLNLLFIAMGCAGLAYGADWLVTGAVGIAETFGVSERIIGLTVVAFGTSVPELVTSSVAAFRKETDISIGNLIGSNIFNIYGILGITAMVTEIPINPDILSSDLLWMLGISLLVFPIMLIKHKVMRTEGFLLFAFYVIYI